MRLPSRPAWSRSLRFALALRWSLVLLVIAAVVVVGLNVALASTVGDAPDARTYRAVEKVRTDDGYRTVREFEVAEVQAVEAATNARTLDTLWVYSGYALAALFATSLAVGWLLSGRALRPVGAMARATELVDARDLSRRLGLEGDDELARLARSIDDMLGRLDRTFASQRQFVDDASHELRTPLAVIRTNVDAVLSHDGVDPAERERAVETTRRSVERMAQLVDDLLASARASAPEEMQDDLRLDELAREEAEEFAVLAQARGVELAVRGPSVGVRGHESAVRRSVDNLLANAVRLTADGSTVTVGVGERDGWAWLAVTDDGPGLAADETDVVFDRFWRGTARSSEGHTGLGLSIVRQVVESHGGEVRVHSEPGRGATFVLWLPQSSAVRDAEGPPAGDPSADLSVAEGATAP